MRVHEITSSGLVKLPLIFAAIGVLGFSTGDLAGSTDAVAYLAVSAAVSIAIGTVASITGDFPTTHAGDIFLFIAVSFAAQNLVVARRIATPARIPTTA